MKTVDVDDVIESRTPLILAVDQDPFPVYSSSGGENWFCVLVPLMTRDGHAFGELESAFPNRGRVWWLIDRHENREAIRPGLLVSSQIELAPKFNASDATKDRYQANKATLTHGIREWLEVVEVPGEPQVDDLLGSGVAVDHPVSGVVLVRTKDSILGPFRAAWRADSGRAALTAANLGKPQIHVAPRSLLQDGDHVREFQFVAGRWHDKETERPITVRLVGEKAVELLRKEGKTVDGGTIEQVVNWALKLANFTKKDIGLFREAMKALESVDGEAEREWPGRLERFKRICLSAERVQRLGADAAEAVAQQDAFKDLVTLHVERLAEVRVREMAEKRRAEVEREVADGAAKIARLGKEIASLEARFDDLKAHEEERLKAENDAWLRNLERRQDDVARRESALANREKEVEKRLERVIAIYQKESQAVGDQLVAQIPLLKRIGIGAGSDARPDAGERPPASPLPTWLATPRPKSGIDEASFVAQFADVARRRGYAFTRDDLVNFHVSAKTGFWTVVAGPSGIGKSSLPRLYAEALGCLDEYLVVPVQPDWLDDRDVIGAYNSLSGVFEPAATGLVDFLIAAAEDAARARGGVFLVTFDEMNLARVEHYLSQFLSVLEEPLERRRLRLFARGVEHANDPYVPYRTLPLGDNIRFVGTVNVDETTHFFSPKVLDRTAVLTLDEPDLSKPTPERAKASELGGVSPVHVDEYRSWVKPPEDAADSREFLVKVDVVLRRIRSGLGVRLMNRLLAYIASARGLLSDDRALDLALAQTVVPRLRVQSRLFSEAVEKLLELAPESRFPRTARYLEALKAAGGEYDFFQLL